MRRFKNCIISAFVTWLYYKNMIHTDLATTIFAVASMAIIVLSLFECLDEKIGLIVMKESRFKRYKARFLMHLNEKRTKGYDELALKEIALIAMKRQTKYAFSGKQIEELLELTKEDCVTHCIQCGKSVARRDVLVTVNGEMCEECLEVS